MTIIVSRINYSTTLDLLINGACRHAQHAPTPAAAVKLYEIAEDLNHVAKRIHTDGLADLLSTPLPPAAPPVDPDPELALEPDDLPIDIDLTAELDDDTPITPSPRAAAKSAEANWRIKTQQRILDHIIAHPGQDARTIGVALNVAYTTITTECKTLHINGQIRREGKRPIYYYPITQH